MLRVASTCLSFWLSLSFDSQTIWLGLIHTLFQNTSAKHVDSLYASMPEMYMPWAHPIHVDQQSSSHHAACVQCQKSAHHEDQQSWSAKLGSWKDLQRRGWTRASAASISRAQISFYCGNERMSNKSLSSDCWVFLLSFTRHPFLFILATL